MIKYAELFGQLLFDLRKKKGLSQEKLAEKSGISRSYIVRLEQKDRLPTLETIFRIAKGLDIKPSKLIALIETQIK